MLEDIVLKEITEVLNVYSESGNTEHNTNRKTYGLSFCKSGKITYKQNGIKYVSDKSVAIVLPKGANYTIYRQETGYFPVINFKCDGFNTDKFILFPIEDSARLIKKFEELCIHIQYNERLKAKSVFYGILSEIDETGKDGNMSRAERFIYNNFGDSGLDNKKIADYLKISETYLNRKFNDIYGTSPKKFVEKVRTENAIKLLYENRNSVSEIAEICGYTNIYSFSRAFKNRIGLSPTEYKKKIRKRTI